MNKIKYIFIFIIVILQACDNMEFPQSQDSSFIKLYGTQNSDYGKDIKLYNGNYLIAATLTNEQSNTDIAIIKTDKLGNQKDIIVIDKGGNDDVSEIILTNDGGFIVLGTTYHGSNENNNIFIAKYNSDLTNVWENIIENDFDQEGTAIDKTGDGFIIAGNTNEKGVKDVYIVKVDTEGNVVWTNSFGGDENDYASDVISISNGFIIIGTSNSFNEDGQRGSNILIIETDHFGIETNKITYGGTKDDQGKTVLSLPEGGYLISGTEENLSQSSNIYIAKIENDVHKLVWSKSYGSNNSNDIINDLIISESTYVLVGSQVNGLVETAILKKIDSSGEILFEKSYGGYDMQRFYSLSQTSDLGYALVGSSGFEGNTQISFLKVNSEGEF